MKANHRILIKLLPTLLLMVGCVMQPGTDEQSSQGEPLSEGATTVDMPNAALPDGVKTAQPTNGDKTQRRTLLQPNTLHGQGPIEQPLSADGIDNPGGPSQDDDGNEPVPQPWAPHCAAAVPAQH
jgi:hypothetical protein